MLSYKENLTSKPQAVAEKSAREQRIYGGQGVYLWKFISGTLRVDFSATPLRFEMHVSVYERNSPGLSYSLNIMIQLAVVAEIILLDSRLLPCSPW